MFLNAGETSDSKRAGVTEIGSSAKTHRLRICGGDDRFTPELWRKGGVDYHGACDGEDKHVQRRRFDVTYQHK